MPNLLSVESTARRRFNQMREAAWQSARRIVQASGARTVLNWNSRIGTAPLAGYQPGQPVFGIDHLSDADLEELNALLPWGCFVTDANGRRFGSPTSRVKRNKPQEIPDRRIVWLNERVPLRDLTVLEIGCFEGIHTIALCRQGAIVKACDARVVNVAKTAIRCAMFDAHPQLVVWNVEDPAPKAFDPSCDIIHHVGVLYHLLDPVVHLHRLAPFAGRALMLDTHYALDTEADHTYEAMGKRYAFKTYGEGGKLDPFSGMYGTARWLRLDDLLSLLRSLGFARTEAVELRQERNGARCLIFAERDQKSP